MMVEDPLGTVRSSGGLHSSRCLWLSSQTLVRCLQLLSIIVTGCTQSHHNAVSEPLQTHRLYEVKDVPRSGILLKGGGSVALLGIDLSWDGRSELAAQAEHLLRGLVFSTAAPTLTVEYDESPAATATSRQPAYVFAGGAADAERVLVTYGVPAENVAYQGFLDLISPMWLGTTYAKGLLLDLNATLIKSGYARADRTAPHGRMAIYAQLEDQAREAGRGLWPAFAQR